MPQVAVSALREQRNRMSAQRHRASPSAADSFETEKISPRELLSQAYTSLPYPFASSASPSHPHRHRSGEWSSFDFARLLLTEQLPQYLPTEASSEKGQHRLEALDEPAGDVTWTPTPCPSSSPLGSWPSQSSLDPQFSLSNTSALLNASPGYDMLPTPFEQHQMQFTQHDKNRLGEDNSWEQQLATSLFGDFPCPPFSDVTPSSSSLPAAALYANVNANKIYSTPLVSPEDRQLTQAGAYAPFPAFSVPPSPQSLSEIYNPTSRSLQAGAGSSTDLLSVAAGPVDPPKRVSAACRFCKARKLRCDGCHPCRQCQRRSVECLYQRETQTTPSRRMTDPSFEAFQSTTAPAPSEGQRSSQHPNQRKRSCTSVAEASLGSHIPRIPAFTSARSWSSHGSTFHSTADSIASACIPVMAGDSTDANRQDSSSNSSYKTAEGKNQTSSGSSSAVNCNNPPASRIQSSRRSSSKGGKKSVFSTISIRGRPDRNRNDPETSAAHEVRYVCPFPGCASHFSTSGHARRHSRIHTVLEPFECPHGDCDKTFTRRDNCTQHQRARHAFQMVAYRKTAEHCKSKDKH